MLKVNRSMIFMFLFIFLISISAFVLINSQREKEIKLTPNNLSLISLGKKIYSQNCASCHGIELEGQKNWQTRNEEGYLPAPPHDETGHTWHHSDEYLFLMTKLSIEKLIGKKYLNNMPAYEEILSDKEIIAVLSFIKSTWSDRIKDIHDKINLNN